MATIRQKELVLVSLLLSPAMMLAIPALTNLLDALSGFVLVLAAYWLVFCIPVAVLFGRGTTEVTCSLTPAKPWIVLTAISAPTAVFLAGNPAVWMNSDSRILVIALVCATINGALEELAWRRPFRSNSKGSLLFEILGLLLFTLWHVPLYFSNGMTFHGGAYGLIGGALLLGALWTLLARATDSIGWPIVSHILVNCAAFLPLFVLNNSAIDPN